MPAAMIVRIALLLNNRKVLVVGRLLFAGGFKTRAFQFVRNSLTRFTICPSPWKLLQNEFEFSMYHSFIIRSSSAIFRDLKRLCYFYGAHAPPLLMVFHCCVVTAQRRRRASILAHTNPAKSERPLRIVRMVRRSGNWDARHRSCGAHNKDAGAPLWDGRRRAGCGLGQWRSRVPRH
jgi:hypothetical protein